jgi:hypothetical protein
MPVSATLPAEAHVDDEVDDDEVDGLAGVAEGVVDEPPPDPLALEDESLVVELALSPPDEEDPSPDGVVAAVREDDPRLSVL